MSFMPSWTLTLIDHTYNLFLTNPTLYFHPTSTAAVSKIPSHWSLINKDLWICNSYFSVEAMSLSQQTSIPKNNSFQNLSWDYHQHHGKTVHCEYILFYDYKTSRQDGISAEKNITFKFFSYFKMSRVIRTFIFPRQIAILYWVCYLNFGLLIFLCT